ncbi:MAG: hypothetical protein KA783_09685 [Chitinophagales bacterium]|nr:hypothetical protein [Chitinophagales bacterium]
MYLILLTDVGTLNPDAYQATPTNMLFFWAIGFIVGMGLLFAAYWVRRRDKKR